MCRNRVLGFATAWAVREVARMRCNYSSPWPVAPFEISGAGVVLVEEICLLGIRAGGLESRGDKAGADTLARVARALGSRVKREFRGCVSVADLFDCGRGCIVL